MYFLAYQYCIDINATFTRLPGSHFPVKGLAAFRHWEKFEGTQKVGYFWAIPLELNLRKIQAHVLLSVPFNPWDVQPPVASHER